MSGSNSDLINALSGGGVLGAIAHPAQINLLADYGSAANTADAIWRTRANQANDLRGQLLQQATDADGNVNMLKYNQLASKAGPTMALAMPAGLTQSTEIAGQQQAQALKNLTAQSTALDSLGPNATYQQVKDKLQEGLDGGWLQRAGAGAVLVGMPQGDDPKSQATRAHILQTIGDQVRSTTERLQSQYGVKSNQTGPGGETIGLSTDQRTGAVSSAQPPGSGVPLGLTAAELDKPFTFQDKTGATQTTTYRQFLIDNGFTGAAGTSGASGLPASLRGPHAPPAASGGAPPAPAPTAAGPRPVETAPSPASLEQQKQTASQSAAKFQGEADSDVGAQQQLATLGNMQSNIGQFVTGTGAEKTLDFKRFIQSWSPGVAKKLGIDPNAVSGQEDFDKAVNLLLSQQNAGSDKQLSVSIGATPHSTLSPEGVDLIVRQLQGNSDYLRARAKLADAYGNKTDYPGFQQSIRDLDPRVFQLQRMSGDQRETYFKALPGQTQRDELKAAWAKTRGLMGQ